MRPIPTTYKRVAVAAAGAIILFGGGVVIGTVISPTQRPVAIMAAIAPTPIARLVSPSAFLGAEAVTIAGKIVERSGDRIVLQDASGKTAVTLHAPDDVAGQLAVGSTVGVQGRVGPDGFEPSFVVLPGNRVITIGRHGSGRGRHHRHDRDQDHLVFLGRMTVVATSSPVEAPPVKS